MIPEKMYERVCTILGKNVSQQQFIGFYNDGVYELMSMYKGDILFGENEQYIPVETVYDCSGLKTEFSLPLLFNILYSFTGNKSYKADFLAEAENIYHLLWHKTSTGRRMGAKRKEK